MDLATLVRPWISVLLEKVLYKRSMLFTMEKVQQLSNKKFLLVKEGVRQQIQPSLTSLDDVRGGSLPLFK